MRDYDVPITLNATSSIRVSAHNEQDAKEKVRMMFKLRQVHAAELENRHTTLTDIGEPTLTVDYPDELPDLPTDWTP